MKNILGQNSIIDTAGSSIAITCYISNVYIKIMDGRVFILPNDEQGAALFDNISNDTWHGKQAIPTENAT